GRITRNNGRGGLLGRLREHAACRPERRSARRPRSGGRRVGRFDRAGVTIVGHSLGAALATYLTLDLTRAGLRARVSACLFASPRTGNQPFVTLFDQTIADYRLFNYMLDIVPRV